MITFPTQWEMFLRTTPCLAFVSSWQGLMNEFHRAIMPIPFWCGPLTQIRVMNRSNCFFSRLIQFFSAFATDQWLQYNFFVSQGVQARVQEGGFSGSNGFIVVRDQIIVDQECIDRGVQRRNGEGFRCAVCNTEINKMFKSYCDLPLEYPVVAHSNSQFLIIYKYPPGCTRFGS